MLFDNFVLFLCIVEKGGLVVVGCEVGLLLVMVFEWLMVFECYYGVVLFMCMMCVISLIDEGCMLVDGV